MLEEIGDKNSFGGLFGPNRSPARGCLTHEQLLC